MKGFFIVLIQRRRAKDDIGNKSIKYWQADLIDPLRGWRQTSGDSMEDAITAQKQQYHAKCAANESVPDLVDMNSGPMASGKTFRFVAVDASLPG